MTCKDEVGGGFGGGLDIWGSTGWYLNLFMKIFLGGHCLLQERLTQNDPKILDNFDPSVSITAPTDGVSMAPETFADIDSDPFALYFPDWDSNTPPKVLITTSPKATDVFPRAEFVRDED